LLQGAKLPQQSAKLPEQCQIFFLFKKEILDFFLVVINKKKQRRERKKEENSSFFFILLVILFFFLIGIFSLLLIPLPRPMSSFMLVGSFLPYLCLPPFMHHSKGVNLEDIVMSRTLFSETIM
jgi:pilus assembly protein TadC